MGRLRHGPVLVVAVILAVAVVPWLVLFHGNATGFIRFGRDYVNVTHPPAHAIVDYPTGYDGQYFWAQARDPLLLHDRTLDDFAQAGSRLQRVAYPALAFAAAAGQAQALPWAMLAINVVAVLVITSVVARYCVRRGWSPWWALCVGLLPGFIVATVGDMSDILATSTMLAGLMLWQSRRYWPAGALLAIAVLTREPMILAVASIGLEMAARGWSARRRGAPPDPAVARAWPVLAVPAAAFLTWQLYLRIRFPGAVVDPGSAYQFAAFITEVRRSLRAGGFAGLWNVVYLILMLAGVLVSLRLAAHWFRASAIAASLFGMSLLVLTFGSDWSYTRLSAPMLAALLLAGLQSRDRAALSVCATAAAMGAVAPLVLG